MRSAHVYRRVALVSLLLFTGSAARAQQIDSAPPETSQPESPQAGQTDQAANQVTAQDENQKQVDTQPENQAGNQAAPVSQRVARLTFVAGEVHVQRADNTGEDNAVLNMALHEGTRLLTGDDGRLEIEFEDGSLARIAPGSGLLLESLALNGETASTRLSLLSGTGYFELRAARGFDYLVEAGGLEIKPVENMSARVALAAEAPPEVAILSGTARVESPGQFHVAVRAGESLRLDAADPARYFLDQTYTEGNWDWWNEERDQAASDEAGKATAARTDYAGAQGYGWSDMDANGSWYDVPGLGLVWQPNAADESFDPYGFGDWVFDAGAYTFVSGYSWGWTPFHCGRWSWSGGFGWGWTAGPECGRWGFGGERHVIPLGSVPGHYRRPQPPPLGGGVHRIVRVRGLDGARPPVLNQRAPVLFNGHRLEPLRPVGTGYTPRGGSAAGRALLRDFPLNHAQPILGVEPGSVRVAAPTPGWHQGRPRTPASIAAEAGSHHVGTAGQAAGQNSGQTPGQQNRTGNIPVGSRSVPVSPTDRTNSPGRPTTPNPGPALGASHSEPVHQPSQPTQPGQPIPRPVPEPRPVQPVQPVAPTPIRPPSPAPAPAPRPAPAPAPAPVRTEPARTDSARPK